MGLIYKNHYIETALLNKRQIRELVGKLWYHLRTTVTNLNGIYEEGMRVVNAGNVGCISVCHLLPSRLPSADTESKMSELNNLFFFLPRTWIMLSQHKTEMQIETTKRGKIRMKERHVNTTIEKKNKYKYSAENPWKEDLDIEGIVILKWICTMMGWRMWILIRMFQ